MNEIGAVSTIIISVLIVFSRRRIAAIGLLIGTIYITQGQGIDFLGINVTSLRIFQALGILRIVIQDGYKQVLNLNRSERAVCIFFFGYFLISLVRLLVEQQAIAQDNFKYRLGLLIDFASVFFFYKACIKNENDLKSFLITLGLVIVPFSLLMLFEGIFGVNPFYLMGGVPLHPVIRDGTFRCQGSFRHSITAGSLGATLIPIYVMDFFVNKDNKLKNILSMLACLAISIASHSSGPILTLLAGLFACITWRQRRRLQCLRWGAVAGLVILGAFMKDPVWFVFARASDYIGGDGWHRSNLIDQFIRNFQEWWLFGMDISRTRDWAATSMNWGAIDVTSEYVSIGLNGGLVSLFLFGWLIVTLFSEIGKAVRRNDVSNISKSAIIWGLGSCLFCNLVNLSGVTYWDQFYAIWFMQLALICKCENLK
jgi:hypothetical protein